MNRRNLLTTGLASVAVGATGIPLNAAALYGPPTQFVHCQKQIRLYRSMIAQITEWHQQLPTAGTFTKKSLQGDIDYFNERIKKMEEHEKIMCARMWEREQRGIFIHNGYGYDYAPPGYYEATRTIFSL